MKFLQESSGFSRGSVKMFKPNDNVKFEWEGETVTGTVVHIEPDHLFPVKVVVNSSSPMWDAGDDAVFTTDGRFYKDGEPILQLENTLILQDITTPFTIVDLDSTRMCLIGGQWMFSSGEVLDDMVYEVLKESVITVIFDPLKQN